MINKKQYQFDSLNQKDWLSRKEQELIAANIQSDEKATKGVIDEVAAIYGYEEARRWREIVLEEHVSRHMDGDFTMGLDDDLR